MNVRFSSFTFKFVAVIYHSSLCEATSTNTAFDSNERSCLTQVLQRLFYLMSSALIVTASNMPIAIEAAIESIKWMLSLQTEFVLPFIIKARTRRLFKILADNDISL